MPQDNKIAPLLQFCVLCDGIAQGPDGKPSFVGVFDMLKSTGMVPQFSIVLRWCNGQGSFKAKLRILNPDLVEIIPPMINDFEMAHRTHNTTGVYNFANLDFPVAGVYWIEISLDEEVVMSIPFPVHSGA